MAKKIPFSPNAPKPIGPDSQAVEAHGIIFFAGQIPLDPKSGDVIKGGIAEQAERVMQNISAALQGADLTFDNVVKSTMYLTDMNDFTSANEIYGKYFKKDPPSRTTIAVAALPKGVKIEVEITAARK